MRYCSWLSVCVLAAKTGFSHKLNDVVKMVGERAVMTFSTIKTEPDLSHYSLDKTDPAPLVRSGEKVPQHTSTTRLNVTIIMPKDDDYNVTLEIYPVEPQDAGTYLARDNDEQEDSVANYVEFIVIGKLYGIINRTRCGKYHHYIATGWPPLASFLGRCAADGRELVSYRHLLAMMKFCRGNSH